MDDFFPTFAYLLFETAEIVQCVSGIGDWEQDSVVPRRRWLGHVQPGHAGQMPLSSPKRARRGILEQGGLGLFTPQFKPGWVEVNGEMDARLSGLFFFLTQETGLIRDSLTSLQHRSHLCGSPEIYWIIFHRCPRWCIFYSSDWEEEQPEVSDTDKRGTEVDVGEWVWVGYLSSFSPSP